MSFLDNSISALQSAMSNINDTAQDWSENWETTKNQLIDKAGEFGQLYAALQNRAAIALSDPDLAGPYQDLMGKGAYIKNTVSTITSNFDMASNWFNNTLSSLKSAIGLSAIPLAMNYQALARRNGLGFLQIVSVGLIVACITAITYWLSDAYEMKTKLDFIATQKGTPAQTQQLADTLFGGFSGNIKSTTKYLVVGGMVAAAGYFLWPTLKKYLK